MDNEQELKIKPCPFCGGEATTDIQSLWGNVEHYCVCLECGAMTGVRATEGEAVQVWNTRSEGL